MTNNQGSITLAVLEQIAKKLSNIKPNKPIEVKANGNKVKVVLKNETEYHVYLDGQFISTDQDFERAFELIRVLLAS
jgi:preprotein translocase subunit SecB